MAVAVARIVSVVAATGSRNRGSICRRNETNTCGPRGCPAWPRQRWFQMAGGEGSCAVTGVSEGVSVSAQECGKVIVEIAVADTATSAASSLVSSRPLVATSAIIVP